jgi:hypothetical protein
MPISVDEEYRSKGGPGGRLPVLIWKPDGLPSDAQWAGRLRPGSIILTTNDGIDAGTHTWWVGADGVAQMAGPQPRPVLSPEAIASMVAWWPLDEASGVRYDVHGTYHLDEYNTPGSAEGVQGLAGSFVRANSEYLAGAAPAPAIFDHVVDQSFTICAWIYPTSLTLQYGDIVSREERNTGAYGVDFVVTVDLDQVWLYTGGTSWWGVNSSADLTANEWHFVAAWYDHTDFTLNIQVNNGVVYTQSSGGQATQNHNTPVYIGMGAERQEYAFDGLIDEVVFFRSVLSEADRTGLYNEHLGVAYAKAVGL